jgi:Ras GTPase-activating-like protein IQGAP2/3
MRAAEDEIWNKERECLLLLLEARVLLRHMVDFKEKQLRDELDAKNLRRKQDQKMRGDLSLMDIANLLKMEPGGDDGDLHSELAKLKRLVIAEIKKNHVLEGNLGRLDLKISLLIVNKGATHEFAAKKKEAWLAKLAASSEKKKKAKAGQDVPRFDLPAKKVEAYGDFFYILQTEPRYLAKCLYLLQPQQVETFLESTIITLFGEAFSPREEYLILNLFLAAMEQEINVVKNVQDFIGADSVVPKLLVTYNRRMQGTVYLRTTLPGVLKTVQDDRNLDLELNPIMIHQTLVPGSNVTEDQALDNPEVKKQLEKRIKDLESICQQFFDTVFSTMDKLPYGLRWICKMMRALCEKQLPDASKDDLLRLTGYFVYYRFINVALVSPEAFKIVTRELGTKERKNLIVVGKVLQKAFNLKNFGKAEKTLMPMNGFIERVHSNLVKYFNDLVQVSDPEDYLQVDQYNEITRKEKPVIVISLTEMISIHRLIYEKLDSLAAVDDPLRAVMKDLGAPPTDFNDADNREIQLTLQSRFKKEVKEEEQNLVTYAETKELCIPILRAVPLGSSMSELTLPDVLETGAEYAKQTGNKLLAEQVATVSKNLQILEAAGLVNPKDDYAGLVHDIAIEVANRAAIRERQKKEIARLTVTLNKLKKNTQFTSEQIAEYEKYLSDALRKQYEGKKEKELTKPKKFDYAKLDQMGVILESELSAEVKKKAKFAFSAPEPGIFEVVAKYDKQNVQKMSIKLDDLLEKNFNQIERLELPQLVFDVNMTLYLVNKHILA